MGSKQRLSASGGFMRVLSSASPGPVGSGQVEPELLTKASRASRTSQRLPPRVARFELVPVADLVLLLLHPAEVHLAPVAEGGEVDETALEVAQHNLHLLELQQRC